MTTFADLSPEAREFVKRAVVEAARIAREQETEACADAIRALPTRDHNAGQWGGYGLGVQPCVKVEDAVAAIVGRGPGGASAEPGGAAPGHATPWEIARLIPDSLPVTQDLVAKAVTKLIADLTGGGGAPAAGEREALSALRDLVQYADANPDDEALKCACLVSSPDMPYTPPPCVWCAARMIVAPASPVEGAPESAALRAPAPPTPPPHES